MADQEDMQLERALVEYAETLEDKGVSLISRLKQDSGFYALMGKALSEIAMLIAGSAVMDSDEEFGKMHRRVLYESREDGADVQALRTYYLTHREAIDMEAVLTDDETKARFERRIKEWADDYKLLHTPYEEPAVRTTTKRRL